MTDINYNIIQLEIENLAIDYQNKIIPLYRLRVLNILNVRRNKSYE